MGPTAAMLRAFGICLAFVLVEGLTSGADSAEAYAAMHLPAYSPPFAAWLMIGLAYYLICGVILYRLLRGGDVRGVRAAAIAVLLVMMGINTVWNIVFFRSQDLALAFLMLAPYDAVALALLVLLMRLDRRAAWAFAPYLAYLVYANVWGYQVWRANVGLGATVTRL